MPPGTDAATNSSVWRVAKPVPVGESATLGGTISGVTGESSWYKKVYQSIRQRQRFGQLRSHDPIVALLQEGVTSWSQ